MKLKNVIKENCICILKGNSKKEVLSELVELIHKSGRVEDADNLKKCIFQREKIMSTGIGLEVAVPHVRIEEINKPIAAIGISKSGIQDYEALDGQSVKIIVMIVAGQGQHRLYLKIMAQVVAKLKESEFRKKLIKAKNTEEVYKIFIG